MKPLQVPVLPPVWLLTTFTGTGTLGMHIFAPALPLVAAEFGASPAATQYTVSLYMAALAVGQLIYGPLSDHFGRRPVLVAGLILFVAAGAFATLAQSLELLILARILQGFGGCAGLVLGRAIVQDVSHGSSSASLIATLNILQLVGSAIAPIIGLALATHFSWRLVPAMLCVLGVAGVVGAIWLLPETGTRSLQAKRLRAYGAVFKAPGFLVYLLVGAFTTTTLFNLLSTMPFVITIDMRRPEHEIGYYYLVLIAGIMTGGYIAKRLVDIVPLDRIIFVATGFSAFCGTALLAMVLTGTLGLVPYVGIGYAFTLTCGVMGVAALVQTAANVGALKGTAVGLYGFTQMGVGALSIMLGSLGPDVAFTSVATLAAFAWAGFLIFLAYRMCRKTKV